MILPSGTWGHLVRRIRSSLLPASFSEVLKVYVIGITAFLEQKNCGERDFRRQTAAPDHAHLEEPFHFGHEGRGIRMHPRGPLAVNQFPVDGKLENPASRRNELKGLDLVLVFSQ